MISFNKPPITSTTLKYMNEVMGSNKLCGDGEFTKKCSTWLNDRSNGKSTLLTTSGTHALEMSAILSEIKNGDEVILPSFTFSSTANAFVLVGAKLVFVDVRPDTMNIDETKIEDAITDKTKAICVVHYAGIACEMDTIMAIANRHNLVVIEDAAQALMSEYKGKPLGSFGKFSCLSFHETKNYSMGEGGALIINDEEKLIDAEILREKGTNRSRFFRGEVDKYNWQDYGSSYLPSEINAAYLWSQLEMADEINDHRLKIWDIYNEGLKELNEKNIISTMHIPSECKGNAHMYYFKAKSLEERTKLINFLKDNGIYTVFHYVPLHSAPAGIKYGRFHGEDKYTTADSDRLLRLPMYYSLSLEEAKYVAEKVLEFYSLEL